MTYEARIKKQILDSIAIKEKILGDLTIIDEVGRAMISAYRNKKKVVWFGNGGSAADSQHLATELVSKFNRERRALPSIAFTTNTSILTAISNDYEYNRVFARQVEAFVKSGDIVIGISTSGNSKNVIQALHLANEMGAVTVGLTGNSGGEMKHCVDFLIDIPSCDIPRIQEAHIMIGHILCDLVEEGIFGRDSKNQGE